MKKMIFLGLVSAFVDIRAMDESIAGQSQHSGASECPGQSRVFPQCTAMSETKLSGFKPQIFRDVRSSIMFENSSSDRCRCATRTVSGEFIWTPKRTLGTIKPKNIFRLGNYDQSQSQILTTILSMPEAQQRMFLKSVDIPDNVEEICELCFCSCQSLSSVTFGEGSNLKLIGKSAFMFSGLREIQIPDNVEELCEFCFSECRSLSRVTFGEASNLKRIGRLAFYGCAFSDILIPAAVQDLGDSCFFKCENLIAVYFLDVTKLQHFGACVFHGCNNDLELDSLYTCRISEQCFEEGGVRKFVGLKYGSPYFKDQLRDHWGPNGYVSVLVDDDTIERLEDQCFMQCKSLESITFGDGSKLKFMGMLAFADCFNLKKISIPNTVEEIGGSCFSSCESLVTVKFGEGSCLCKIGERAFADCFDLKKISIPNTVEEIGESCFSTCESLVAVKFGEGSCLCKIRESAFANCFNLRELNLPDRVESIPDNCFFACRQLDITFGRKSRLRYIGNAAFADDEPNRVGNYPRTIYIPDGVEELGDQCFLFSGCTSIIFGKHSELKMAGSDWCLTGANVVYPQKLRDVIRANLCRSSNYLEMPTFQAIEHINKSQVEFRYYDSNAQEQTISLALENKTALSLYDLDQETAMQVVEVTIPPNTKILDYGCFSKCVNLRKITFADGSQLKLIRSGAFGGTKLTEITIPDSVEELGVGCFCLYSTYMLDNLSVVRFAGDSQLKTIGAYAFSYTTINTINIPDSVEVIGRGAFYRCRNLSSVTFGESSGLKYIDESAFSESYLCEIHIPDAVEKLCDKCFLYCCSLSRVIFGEASSLKFIGEGAFGYSGLREIQIPDSVEEICDGCFVACLNLRCITFGEASNLQRIGQKVFDDSGLTKVCAPKNVQDLIRQVLVGTKLDGKVTFSDPQ